MFLKCVLMQRNLESKSIRSNMNLATILHNWGISLWTQKLYIYKPFFAFSQFEEISSLSWGRKYFFPFELCLELLDGFYLAVCGGPDGREEVPSGTSRTCAATIMSTLCSPKKQGQNGVHAKRSPKRGCLRRPTKLNLQTLKMAAGKIPGQAETFFHFSLPFYRSKPQEQLLEIAELSKASCIQTERKKEILPQLCFCSLPQKDTDYRKHSCGQAGPHLDLGDWAGSVLPARVCSWPLLSLTFPQQPPAPSVSLISIDAFCPHLFSLLYGLMFRTRDPFSSWFSIWAPLLSISRPSSWYSGPLAPLFWGVSLFLWSPWKERDRHLGDQP